MSALIKGLDMPDKKNGAVLIFYPNGKVCYEDGTECEAVELPPHGRLIDADALRERLRKMIVRFGSAYEKDGKEERLAALLELDLAARYIINEAPTIIEAEDEDNG